jgi:hypothetical protein
MRLISLKLKPLAAVGAEPPQLGHVTMSRRVDATFITAQPVTMAAYEGLLAPHSTPTTTPAARLLRHVVACAMAVALPPTIAHHCD